MRKTKGFGLLGVIIIMVVTAVVSAVSTGIIILNSEEKPAVNGNYVVVDDNLKEFIEVYETVKGKFYDKIDYGNMLKAAEEGMINYLGDKYTVYMENGEFDSILDELSGSYEGIGVSIVNNAVIHVTENSPADKQGIKVNDLIISIDGVNVEKMSSQEISSLISSSSSKNIAFLIKRLDQEYNINITKEKIISPTIIYNMIDNDSIGYMYIKNFSETLDTQVKNALAELESKGMKSLIIDVRDDIGGYLSAAENTASIFLEKNKTIYSLQTSDSTTTFSDKTDEKRDYPIVILTNGNTASASEILAAALKESYGAILIGTKTYGKGKVQQVMTLEGGSSVKYTTAKWLTPSSKCIDGTGIMPDIVVEYTPANKENPYDSQITKAIETLNKNI